MGEADEPDIPDNIRSGARSYSYASERAARGRYSPQDPAHQQLSRDDTYNEKSSNGHHKRPGPGSGHTGNGVHRSGKEKQAASGLTSEPSNQSPAKSEVEGTSNTAVTTTKPSRGIRLKNGIKRFGAHTKEALLHSYVNILLVFVPAGIAVQAAGVNPAVVFALNAIAIIPLAGLLTHATESVALRLGDTLGALLNVSFGNAVELIIFIIALVKNEIRIVQASLLGSILSNLLLILGMAFVIGGLRYQEQIYNSTVTQMSACLLSLSVTSLLLPTAFYASFSDSSDADDKTLKVSRGTSVVLLIVYILYLVFQLKSHAYLYESTPQHIIDEESHPGILAEMLDSSSSSSDSDTTADSDTDTSGSQTTTTKRIKRALRSRKRRKSSASSIKTSSLPSMISSPSVERSGHQLDLPTVASGAGSRRPSALNAITSGDEADTDGENDMHRDNEPRVRDFVEKALKDKEQRKKKRSQKKAKKHHRHAKKNSNGGEGSSTQAIEGEEMMTEDAESRPQVSFVDEEAPTPSTSTKQDQSRKKGFGLRQPLTRQSLRPTLPKYLSQTVFTNPPATQSGTSAVTGSPSMARSSSAPGLRRTSSLPDRLNRQNTPTSARPQNLPPYPRAGQRGPRVRTVRSDDFDPTSDSDEDEKPPMSRTAAAVLLLISTALVAVCAEFLVDAIPGMIDSTPVSQAFIGLIILPIVSNAAEHVTAVTVASKNKMDLAIGVAVGSSIQIAIFVTPLVVILGWIIGRDMSLYFNLFETVSLFVTAFVVNFLVLDGRSNYLEGSLLIAAYAIIA